MLASTIPTHLRQAVDASSALATARCPLHVLPCPSIHHAALWACASVIPWLRSASSPKSWYAMALIDGSQFLEIQSALVVQNPQSPSKINTESVGNSTEPFYFIWRLSGGPGRCFRAPTLGTYVSGCVGITRLGSGRGVHRVFRNPIFHQVEAGSR